MTQPKLIDGHSWRVSRAGKTYDLTVDVFFVPLGVSLPSLEHGRYRYVLLEGGTREVAVWERDTREPLPAVQAFAERQFENYVNSLASDPPPPSS